LLTCRPFAPSEDVYLVYRYNRFQACRYGLGGTYIDATAGGQRLLQRDVLDTLQLLQPHARTVGTEGMLAALHDDVATSRSAAAWLRDTYRKLGSLNDVARRQSEQWMGPATTG
jgi:carboxylate-amine ligase